jgi:hypothetical protein
MPSKSLHIGDIVMSADGKDLGIVRELGDTCFRINAKRKRDFWLSNDSVDGRDNGIAVLLYDHNRLDDAFVDVLTHTGAHSHPKQPKQAGGSVMTLGKPLMMLAGGAFWVLRDKERREKAMQLVSEVKTQVQQKRQQAKGGASDHEATPGYSATSTFVPPSTPPTPTPATARTPEPPRTASSPPPASTSAWAPAAAPSPHITSTPSTPSTASSTPVSRTQPEVPEADIKAREEAIVKQVTEAFPANDLRVSPVAVHTLEGREVETLRFTVDEMASSDVQLERLARESTSPSAVAEEIIRDLRLQLPQQEPGQS